MALGDEIQKLRQQVQHNILSLNEQLEKLKEQALATLPPEALEALKNSFQELEEIPFESSSLKASDHAPDFALPNSFGKIIRLKEVLSSGPIVLSFYRGEWSSFCELELKALQTYLPEIRSQGGAVLAVSPQDAASTQKTVEKSGLTYDVVSDRGNKIAKLFGVSYAINPSQDKFLTDGGIDLEKCCGQESKDLPTPATFVIDQESVIRFAFVNSDYTRRAEPSEIVEVLRTIKKAV